MTWLDERDTVKVQAGLDEQQKLRDAGNYTALQNFHHASEDERFALWISLVDRQANRKLGISVFDLADFMIRDAYDNGDSPSAALRLAMEGDDLYAALLDGEGDE